MSQTRVNTYTEQQTTIVGKDLASTVRVSMREDGSAIERTQTLAALIPPLTFPATGSLTNKMEHGCAEEASYMIRLQGLIAKILIQFVRIADKERLQKEEQKLKFTVSNKEWGILQKELGDRGFKFTGIALGVMAGQFMAPEEARDLINYLAREGCTNLLNTFNTETQSRQKLVEGIATLAQTELSSIMNKGDPSSKQELISLLERILDLSKRAAQAG